MEQDGVVRVLVVDDHPGVRLGIANLVQSDFPRMQAVGAVGTPEEALLAVASLQPHVVVLDVNLAGADGLALIPLLQHAAPCRIVVLTSLLDTRIDERASRLGAAACVRKTAPASDLMQHISAAGVWAATGQALAAGTHVLPAGDEAPIGTGRT
jgi:DNA-binding NarL/FixJ family response regulator